MDDILVPERRLSRRARASPLRDDGGGRAGLDRVSVAGGQGDAAFEAGGDAEEIYIWFVSCVVFYNVGVLWLGGVGEICMENCDALGCWYGALGCPSCTSSNDFQIHTQPPFSPLPLLKDLILRLISPHRILHPRHRPPRRLSLSHHAPRRRPHRPPNRREHLCETEPRRPERR